MTARAEKLVTRLSVRRPVCPATTRLALCLVSGVLGFACASGPSPAESPTTAEEPNSSPATNSAAANDSEIEAASTAEVEPASHEPPAPETPDPAAICERLCERVERECTARTAEGCRASCSDYVRAWQTCPVEVELALTCQTDAPDATVCANMAAPSCVPLFTSLADCRAGRVPPRPREDVVAEAEGQERLPDGWQRIEDQEFGISLPLPAGVSDDKDDSGKRRLIVSEGSIDYLVESPPPLKGSPTDKALLKAVLDYIGTDCHKTLKVHGRFETGQVVHVHFETTCKDGLRWKGMFHVSPTRTVATSARSHGSLADISSKLESLYYGFRYLSE